MESAHEEIIEKALKNQLTPSERDLFDSYMNDPEFAKEYSYRISVKEAITIEERTKIKAQLQELESNVETGEPVNKGKIFNIRPIISIAASLLIIVGAYFVLKPYASGEFNTNIYASYYEKPSLDIIDVQRSAAPTKNSDQLILDAYNSNDYEAFLSLLESNPIEDPRTELFRGIAHLEMDNWEEAKKIFKSLSENENSKLAGEAIWYEALTYTKLKDNAKVIALLKKLKRKDHYLSEDVTKMLKEFDE